MGEKTNIQWCDSTINPTSGCDGCELWSETSRTCYAGNLHEGRLYPSFKDTRPELYAKRFDEVRMIPGRMAQAANWSDLRGVKRPKKTWLSGKPRAIFVGDLGDFMSRAVTDEYFEREILGAITSKAGSRHFWMMLTKRPGRLADIAEAIGGLPDNVMAMTTVTTQRTADARIPELLRVRCKWRGVSVEPLLEGIDFTPDNHELLSRIDWVIVGGESGTKARPCNIDWIRSIVRQCKAASVPCFVKQLGSNVAHDEADLKSSWRYDLKHPKGGDPSEWPADLRVQQWPKGGAR